ncbi:MAG: hypothetical protein CMH69_18135 [Nitratireductor sp.]|jgi:AcrR family transcriptional regulator|uniref:TetR/AcrR family transcriptional regulator n=1 Tax=Nitratireductor sp. L15S-10 TaxID=3034028 RepID=UPI000C8DC5DA|nr:hypothetical protein [Nitratireductor sp.]
MGRRPITSRDVLLDSAEAVVLEEGVAHLILDAVSAKAGVSKGGLLYSLPIKEAWCSGCATVSKWRS